MLLYSKNLSYSKLKHEEEIGQMLKVKHVNEENLF